MSEQLPLIILTVFLFICFVAIVAWAIVHVGDGDIDAW